jgi:hydrogenase nickel incorporation protein HypA/HybF
MYNSGARQFLSRRTAKRTVVHELTVTESLLNLALHHAEHAHATRVTDLRLVVGRLSSIVDDSVQFYWDMISAGTICEGATLHFERVPARLLCLDCNQVYTLNGELTGCPHCDSQHVKVTSGDEFRLDSIDVEK